MPTGTHTVESVTDQHRNSQDLWRIIIRATDGTGMTYLLPKNTLEWRAAEYGIDPNDVDTLLDIVLHEPHIPATDDDQGMPRLADTGPTLWTATNTTTARTAHMARIRTCPVQIDVRTAKTLDTIRHQHAPDLDRIRAMREAVDTNRWLKRYGDLPARPKAPLEAPHA